MILLRTIRNRHFRAFLDLQSPSNSLKNPFLISLISSNSIEFSFPLSIHQRPFSLAAQFAKESDEEKSQKCVKPLSVIFKEAVGLSVRTENGAVEDEDASENAELKQKLRKLEEEMRRLNKKSCEIGETSKLHTEKGDLVEQTGAKRSLWELFHHKETEEVKLPKRTDYGTEDPMVHKELSSDMQMFTQHLYMEGYLKDATFLPKNKFDVTHFERSYARDFLKYAAVNFGRDHQEIAKWLSASDLKRIALFGCPSLGQRSIHAAKHMRAFFEIEEHKVCQTCVLKDSCKHANKKSRKKLNKLLLAEVTRVLIMYAMESVPQQLVVPEEIRNSVSRLLKEMINLSETVS
ncbi:uncharacterized protein LOC105165462 [Sesamum indicum]|uniref:Uncharacterized protein LOC105165462 n=1 Tax=Sesamum indicum TaxID=4182 RepID=A0A6I9TFQ5_SESIN|nr:uncharacterized protein LOC105165462 [Sesamum indicum]XP_011082783.1 uncharacterized protein LOC105165462 [Sesamum indicum]